MAFDREAAKQAGYTEDEINAYLQAEAEKQKTEATTAVVADVGEPPAPTTVVKPIESTAASVATTAGIGLAPYVVPAAAAGAAAFGGSKLYSGWKAGTDAAEQLAKAKLASEAGIADREFVRQGVMTAEEALARQAEREAALNAGKNVAKAVKPVVPQGPISTGPVNPNAGQQAFSQMSQQLTNRVPTTGVTQGAQMAEQAAARAPSLLDKTTSMIRQLAANKVVQGLSKWGGLGGSLATYSPELGPPVPQQGRMRGMEINPMTGRPWTKEQLAAYNANPSLFDSQLPPAQMPR